MQFSSTFSALINKTIQNNMFTSPGPISVYSGVQPTPATFEGSFSSYNSTNSAFLAHFSAPSWTSNAATMSANGVCQFQTTTSTGNATPIHSGTAAWAVIWDSTVVSAPATTLPTANYIICDVGNMTSNSAIRMVSTTLSTSTSTRIEDAGFTLAQP